MMTLDYFKMSKIILQASTSKCCILLCIQQWVTASSDDMPLVTMHMWQSQPKGTPPYCDYHVHHLMGNAFSGLWIGYEGFISTTQQIISDYG